MSISTTVRQTGLAEYAAVDGHRSTLTLRRIEGDQAEFALLTIWDSWDAVRRFAGDDPGRAVFYPEDDRYLVARDDRVTHFEIVDHQPIKAIKGSASLNAAHTRGEMRRS